jgi:DNA-binding NarL/FixJ family response regulator
MGEKTVLVVEDVPELSRLLELTFELDGRLRSVGTASGAEHALELAEQRRPDIVVLDIGLEGGRDAGLRLLTRLHEAVPGVRVVVFSGRDDPDLRRQAEEHGAATWITKGGDLDELVDALLEN